MKIYEPICFQNAAVSPIDLRPFEVEKQEVNSAEVLAATFTVLAVLSELEIISLGGKSKECFYTQKCVNHGPPTRKVNIAFHSMRGSTVRQWRASCDRVVRKWLR